MSRPNIGLDIPKYELIDFAWLDMDNDGDMDLLTHEDTGYYIYRNQGGKFAREFVTGESSNAAT